MNNIKFSGFARMPEFVPPKCSEPIHTQIVCTTGNAGKRGQLILENYKLFRRVRHHFNVTARQWARLSRDEQEKYRAKLIGKRGSL